MLDTHGMVALLLLALSTAPLLPAASSCITNYGKTVCGYHCIAAHGELGCARTSAGVCGATESELVCWDPPDSVRAHYGDHVPVAECLAKNGHLACGYHCESRDGGEVACASTPDGVCIATPRGVTCWDPPVSAYCADDKPIPRPRCLSVSGRAACGYDCRAKNGEIACASTPGGSCQILPDRVQCTDPEAPPMCGGKPCNPDDPKTGRPWCHSSLSGGSH